MATYTFEMPAVEETPAGFGFFWRYRIPRADSLILVGGVATQQRTFEVSELTGAVAAGGFYYIGGHKYTLSTPEVTQLTAAGYGAYITTTP